MMNQLAVISDSVSDIESLRQTLADDFELRFIRAGLVPKGQPDQFTLFDINLKDSARLIELKNWLTKRPKDSKVIFAVDKASRVETIQAHALGATDIVYRPVDRKELLAKIWGDFSALAGDEPVFLADSSPGVVAAFDALHDVFAAACLGENLEPESINEAGEQVVSQIGAQGLSGWIDTVRKHHSQTYQHCLLVTGVAVGFGQHLGISHRDRMRLSFAGMLHDIGKARIPVAILEKPGPLDDAERKIMQEHPQLGIDALNSVSGIPSEMLDMVLHHHEYLDGSGYPHGLKANEITDLVRIMTISDIFGALMERRSYKPPMSGDKAYSILMEMGPKLDQDLVREFRGVAHLERH